MRIVVNSVKAKWVDVQVGEEPIYEEKDVWIETKPAWDEQVLVKEAYDEVINHPEEGHWVCNGDSQEPDQKPEQPENPDQKPEQPENPDQKPEQPENPDVETPEVPEQKPEENKENVQTQAAETKKEGTTPKTGDTASSLPVAGVGITSLGVALATILKKRK